VFLLYDFNIVSRAWVPQDGARTTGRVARCSLHPERLRQRLFFVTCIYLQQGKLLFCHPPGKMNGLAFNAETYEEGGLKFREACEARLAHLEKEAKGTGAPVNRGIDGDFFSAKDSGVKAKTIGKFRDEMFARANMFPHQSGYVMAAPSMVGSVMSTMTEAFGKKTHKNGKRRVKDRSWKA
jgi:hypothetical protein